MKPTTIVILGITGDLAQKKLLPAIYDLYTKGKIPNTKIVGFSRREFSEEAIREFVKSTIQGKNFDENFLDLVSYVRGDFDQVDSYKKLGEHLKNVCDKELGTNSNKLFYLSVPPNLYEVIATHIAGSGLANSVGMEESFSRILVEKPFGKDLYTAENLDLLLSKLFKEEQIYRIDHYVAKESLLNIVNFHRKEEATLHVWDKEHIEKIEIDLFETATVGSRGATYDGVGAFCDVGQNHMLQIVALLAMDIPKEISAKLIQDARASILESLLPLKNIAEMKRGQYEGYLSEPNVSPNSTTETFFSLSVFVSSGKLAGVPFVLKSGKALSKNLTEVRIYFKDGKQTVVTVPSEDSLPAYEKIFLDCIRGDQTIFVSTREITAQWKYITPIVEFTSKNKPFIYQKGTNPDTIDNI